MVKTWARASRRFGRRYRGRKRKVYRKKRFTRRVSRKRRFTRTRPRLLGRIRTQGANFQSSGMRMPFKKPRAYMRNVMKNLVEPQGIEGQGSGNVASGIGLQGVFTIATLSRANLQTYKNASTTGTPTLINKRFFMRSSNFKLNFRNNASNNVKYTVYDCIARRDGPDLTLDTPLEAWNKGMLDYSPTPLNPSGVVGTTPFKSPEFNYYWKVNKITTGQLEPGMTHEHTVRRPINKFLDSMRFDNTVGNAIAGWTQSCMIVYSGALVHNSTAPGSVGPGNASLDYMYSVQDSFGFVEKNIPSYILSDNLPKGPFTTAFLGESTDVPASTVVA